MLQLLIVVGVVPLPEGLVEVICPLHLRACGVFLLHHVHIVFLEALLILSVCSCWKTTLLSPLFSFVCYFSKPRQCLRIQMYKGTADSVSVFLVENNVVVPLVSCGLPF